MIFLLRILKLLAQQKFNSKKEIVLNTNYNQSIWFIFETDDKDNNNKNINLEDIPNNMIDNKNVKDNINNNNIEKPISIKEEDILGNLNNGMENKNNIQSNNNYNNNIENQNYINSNNINKVNNNIYDNEKKNNNNEIYNPNLINLLDQTFQEMNHDFFYIEPIFLAVPPIEDSSFFQVDI